MTSLDEVPFRIPTGSLEEAGRGLERVSALELSVPDYIQILQDTEYEFSLENWVLAGLQGGYSSVHRVSASDQPPSCPPYWMMFSSPQESRLASRRRSDIWEPDPLRRCRSLNAALLSTRAKSPASDSEEDDGRSEEEARSKETPSQGKEKPPNSGSSCRVPGRKDFRQNSSPNSLMPSQCGLEHRRGSFSRSSLSVLDWTVGEPERIQPRPVSPQLVLSSGDGLGTDHLLPQRVATTTQRGPTLPAQTLRSHTSIPDPSAELLAALNPEERELLEAITAQGYPLRSAVSALQKTGQRSPQQIVRYLLACDHLCDLGYDEAQVEEALEMFQNCESKAKEFLHLLTQFNEMGFQQNTIKEVLLVHENHRERALEELMMRVA